MDDNSNTGAIIIGVGVGLGLVIAGGLIAWAIYSRRDNAVNEASFSVPRAQTPVVTNSEVLRWKDFEGNDRIMEIDREVKYGKTQ